MYCDNCDEEWVDGSCPRCEPCEICGEMTDNGAPLDDYGIVCRSCEDGCGTCGYLRCQCDAMYDAWKERDL